MPNLVIDIGNTLTKAGLFENGELISVGQYNNPAIADIHEFCNNKPVNNVMVSSVKKNDAEWLAALRAEFEVGIFSSSTAAGLNNHYKTPATLGTDRLAAVIGAHSLYPAANNVIIGGGTCITYDFVDSGANYFGGSISPGLNMRYKAVNHYTAALPLLTPDESFGQTYGNDTASAIRSGVQNGVKYELQGFINQYIQTSTGYNIILHGGDSIFFDTLLKNSIFAPYIKIEPYLVLKGLNAAIQKHND